MSLGDTIRNKRKFLKLSQEYVAEQLEVSRQAVSKWERNQSQPSTKNLLKLADLFESDIQELTSPETGEEDDKKIKAVSSKKDSNLQKAAAFGRVLVLISPLGYMGAYGDSVSYQLPIWYLNMWWGILFLIGLVLSSIASRDYFNRKRGSKKIIWLDLLFAFNLFLYGILPFGNNINTSITLFVGTVIMIIINTKFFIPVWRKPKELEGGNLQNHP